ncbi:N-acetylmuramoyl-L-alanine amidase-like domain-containing protein [Legionella israelensis]|uniref:DUF1460 domain-containing protein n=2 Tax=Legionella israelensis TaxID=454 RepID=A0A0W0V2F0_9GAMM|nr:N-acetylmuramoyl-L-alanine amidase-like domain-containing protein [Legionella israelensis]KTD14266.1 hypothetical protein Lisr_2494 [Legionella israelensis]SCX93459.1 Protein of unknown function [Legionella israelensis DSM 19235]STX57517.1 Protein of uncharacterised function (DUF1460) [Legionella israelensis]
MIRKNITHPSTHLNQNSSRKHLFSFSIQEHLALFKKQKHNHQSMVIARGFLIIFAVILFSSQIFAKTSPQIEQQANKAIEQLYHSLDGLYKTTMPERIEWISAQFKNKPYLLGALGEGYTARFDQFPRYRTDAFDCATYVTTVMAIALANNTKTFEQCLKQVRYKNGRRSYIHRNHFTSLDWNVNNQSQGFLQDITLTIKNHQDKPIAQIAKAVINKPAWYQYKTTVHIRLHPEHQQEQQNRLEELKTKGQSLEIREAKIPYLPLNELFNNKKEANHYIFKQIPHGAIIEIIRPNWDLREKIGTCLNVSHIGFAIWSNGILYYREASSTEGKVIDIPLISYLKNTLDSPTIKGINVQVIKPQTPFEGQCKIN